jgi:hypothetical protein
MSLAPDVRAFLRQADGGEIVERTSDGDRTVTFLSCRTIVQATMQVRALLRELDRQPTDTFVAVVDYEDGDVLMVDTRPGRGGVVDGWHDEVSVWHTKMPIAPSFDAFVDMLLSAVERDAHVKFWLH